MTAEYFPDHPGRYSEEEERFVAAVRRESAAALAAAGIGPERSRLLPFMATVVAELDMLTVALGRDTAAVQLHLEYFAGSKGLQLDGCWSSGYVLDDVVFGSDQSLVVQGLRKSPEEFGAMAANWLESQLRRPVIRRTWSRGECQRSSLIVGDRTLRREGGRPLFLKRPAPVDEVVWPPTVSASTT